jgi:flagellar L-ring protein FlgH
MAKNQMKKMLVAAFFVSLLLTGLNSGAESIYRRSRDKGAATLFGDFKARHVGDIVTILVVENNSASESSTVDTDKSHGFDFSLSKLFGIEQDLFGSTDGSLSNTASFQGSNNFAGDARTTNQGQVSAQLTAEVKEVLPNGNLLIEGRRAIYFNKEEKHIVLSGVIRPQDISSGNTIQSTFIADATIKLEGFGEVTKQSQPGLLSKILNLIPIF